MNIQKIKRMKIILLLQFNLVMLLLLLFCVYYVRSNWPFPILLATFCIAIWGFMLLLIYARITGKPLGTKTARIVHAFDKEHTKYKSWRRRELGEIIVVGLVCAGFTVFLITGDFDNLPLNSYVIWHFTGGWIGTNIGMIARIVTLE